MFLKVLRTDGGERLSFFGVTANRYRSLVSANTPRGADVTGVLLLDFSSVCFPTTNFTEVFSIDNACFVAGRWFGLCAPSYPDHRIDARPTTFMLKQAHSSEIALFWEAP